jgi:Ca-activated chloride channel homolog
MEKPLNVVVFTLLILLSVLGCGIAVSGTAMQETTREGFTITVNSALVTTDVTVIGTAVSELRAEDFTVYDNGVAQRISHFSQDMYPLAVALLIDRSDSIRSYLPTLQIAALSALRHLRPDDQVALFAFNADLEKLCDLTRDRLLIGKRINTLKVGGSTNLHDSIYEVAQYLSRNAPNSRRAVILVSDNCHTESEAKHDASSARVEMLEASATLYGIKTSGDYCSNSVEVEQIASETGGEILDAHSATSLPAALEKAMTNLRMQYTLGFSPSNSGENGSFHRLAVKVAEDRCPGCRLLARSGYYAGISAPVAPLKEPLRTPTADPARKTDQALIQRSILTAATTLMDMADIPLTVKTFEQKDPAGYPQLKVDLQIDGPAVKFTEEGGRRAFRIFVTVFYFDEKGNILGYDAKTLHGPVPEEGYRQIMKEGFQFSTTIPQKSKKQILKVVVYDEGSDRMGSKLIMPLRR